MTQEKLINPDLATSWKYFIQICLEREDFEGAVKAFEKIAEENSLCPYQFKLIETLMEHNELEMVQRVLDMSIRVVGEQRTLYNAIFMFLSLGKSNNLQKIIGTVQFLLHCDLYHKTRVNLEPMIIILKLLIFRE